MMRARCGGSEQRTIWIASHRGTDLYHVIDAHSPDHVFVVRVSGAIAQIESGNRWVGNDARAAAIRAAAKRCDAKRRREP